MQNCEKEFNTMFYPLYIMKALIMSADNFEDLELFYPYYRLKEESIEVLIGSESPNEIKGKNGYTVKPDITFEQALDMEFDLIIIPGGRAPERVRLNHLALNIVREAFDSKKPVGAICHGPQVLISAGVVKGKKLTCYRGIKDDVISAGGLYVDERVVVDGNLITSRIPDDLPHFMKALLEVI